MGKVEQARQRIADAVEACPTVYALFSGGKDSLAILHLAEPWPDRIKALWINAGHPYPETETFIRATVDRLGFDLVEAKSDIRESWAVNGIPAPVAASALSPWHHGAPIRLTLKEGCCMGRGAEFFAAEFARSRGQCVFLKGTRAADNLPMWQEFDRQPAGVHVSPMADWSDGDVLAFLDAEGAELPPSYAAGLPGGLDCRICPAMSRAQLDYLRTRDPGAAGEVDRMQGEIAGAVVAQIEEWRGRAVAGDGGER